MNKLQEMITKKWFLAAAGGLILITLLLLSSSSKQKEGVDSFPPIQQSAPQSQVSPASRLPSVVPTKSAAMQKALDEAKQSAAAFDNRQTQLRTDYPWLRKFPLSGDGKYFVYFDLGKNVFIGKIYPKAGDDAEQIKAQIMQHFIQRQIPIDSYPFEWTVFPK